MGIRSYRSLLTTRSVGVLLATSLVGRLPIGMTSLALLLAFARSGSYGHAGLVMAADVVGAAVSSPPLGRALDRWGRRSILLATGVAYLATMMVLAFVVSGSVGVVLPVAFLAGAAQPPLGAAARSLWTSLLDGERRQTMYALEATLQELIFIVGPALVAGIGALAGPATTLAVTGAIGCAGAMTFALHPVAGAVVPRATRTHGALRSSALRRLLGVTVLFIGAIAMVEVAIVAAMSGGHASSSAGIAFAVWSGGSLVGGLLFGARSGGLPLSVAMIAVAAGFGVLALAPGPVGLCVLLAVGGMAVAPTIARIYSLTGDAVDPAQTSEAFSWLTTATLIGASAGSAAGGQVVGAFGPRVVFVLAMGLTAAAVIPWRWRRRARPAPIAAVAGTLRLGLAQRAG